MSEDRKRQLLFGITGLASLGTLLAFSKRSTTKDKISFHDVTDTARWVAHWRGVEGQRKDALFSDPLATKLAGERGKSLAEYFEKHFPGIDFIISMRTMVIDTFLKTLVAEKGVDCVLNLGAGLDTRPYRLTLPNHVKWVEVDLPEMITWKREQLLLEPPPKIPAEMIALDLSNREERDKLLSKLASENHQILVLTEGVIPYLTEEEVSLLAQDLRKHKSFKYWIVDFTNPKIYRQVKKMNKIMQHCPFQFFPANFELFFLKQGWQVAERKYLAEEGEKIGRNMPLPLWARILFLLLPFTKIKGAGYAILESNSTV